VCISIFFRSLSCSEDVRPHVEEVVEQFRRQHRVIGGVETTLRQLDIGSLTSVKKACRFRFGGFDP
jgi:hypothetical protein